jgi:hypothetical protein
MKNIYFVLVLVTTFSGSINSIGQTPDSWTQKATTGGIARQNAVGFSIGTKGYIGTGDDINGNFYKDFWEYDPTTNAWSQKADFGGTPRHSAVGFSIGDKGYIGTGQDVSFIYTNDFWEYDPGANAWTRKTDFGGSGRWQAVGFGIGTKGYIGTGQENITHDIKDDFWEYDPAFNSWTQKASFGGGLRHVAVGFSMGVKGYVGTGVDDVNNNFFKDFWEYDPLSDNWTRKSDFGGEARVFACGFSIGLKGYLGTGNISTALLDDFWEYDLITDSWTQKADYGGGLWDAAVGFGIGDKGYMGTGVSIMTGTSGEFWEYTPTCTTPSTPYITNSGDTLFSSAQYGNQWYFEGNLIPGATSQSCIATASGYYWDVVTLDGCTSDTSNHLYILISGMDLNSSGMAGIYPVPCNGRFTVSFSGASEEYYTVSVNNLLGMKVFGELQVKMKDQILLVLDIRPVPDGLYTIIFRGKKENFTRKILIIN